MPVLVEHESMREHHVEGRSPTRAAGFQAARTETSRGAGRSLRDTSRYLRRRRARAGLEFLALLEVKACVEPESNQTSRMSSTFSPFAGIVIGRKKRAAASGAYQASAPSRWNARAMRSFTRVLRISSRHRLLAHEDRDRHAPGALARNHPVGPASRSCP